MLTYPHIKQDGMPSTQSSFRPIIAATAHNLVWHRFTYSTFHSADIIHDETMIRKSPLFPPFWRDGSACSCNCSLCSQNALFMWREQSRFVNRLRTVWAIYEPIWELRYHFLFFSVRSTLIIHVGTANRSYVKRGEKLSKLYKICLIAPTSVEHGQQTNRGTHLLL